MPGSPVLGLFVWERAPRRANVSAGSPLKWGDDGTAGKGLLRGCLSPSRFSNNHGEGPVSSPVAAAGPGTSRWERCQRYWLVALARGVSDPLEPV